MASPFSVRIFGDPVLRSVASEITDIDGKLVKLAENMLTTMYAEPGIGLAAPQVGVRRRMFVYDVGDGPRTIINPVITESQGEWSYLEGCLSVPGLSWEIVRPKQLLVNGIDLDGNEVSLEADELLARLVQHELDHLNGVLLIDHLERDERRRALGILRQRYVDADLHPGGLARSLSSPPSAVGGSLQLP
ncbi:MAG: peptide deformylase [Acidimicrobiia bacterium]|nr:peptide deformylase [Acidimicrobiia bacterium]